MPTIVIVEDNAPTRDAEQYAPPAGDANHGLWDWNLCTDEVYWSPRWKAMLGYADSDIGVSSNEWFDRVHPDDLVAVSQALAVHLEDQSTHLEIDHRIRDRRGVYRLMRCRAEITRNSGGVATRLAGSFADVGEP
jgi:PAS domain-containing protein